MRPASQNDVQFLREMLCEAACWREGVKARTPVEILEPEELANLLRSWGERGGDFGLVATSLVQEGQLLGAAWYRYWTENEHSYGFVDAATPELAIAVVPSHRGEGIGRRLLLGLLDHAAARGVSRLSLSVEHDNPAYALYESCGFRYWESVGNAHTMVCDLTTSTG